MSRFGGMGVTATLAGLLLWAGPASAQSPKTENTLTLDAGAPRPQVTLADLGLLVGQWRGEFLGGTADEVWLPPAGGSMIGMFRLIDKDKVVFHEFWTVVEEDGGVVMRLKHFHPDLKGWEEKNDAVVFKVVKVSADTVWFEGLTYRKGADGALQGFIALGRKDGTAREEAFVFRPVRPATAR
jgi:hypothetical protein